MGFEFGSWTVSTDWTRYTVYQPAGRSGIGKQMTRSFSPETGVPAVGMIRLIQCYTVTSISQTSISVPKI